MIQFIFIIFLFVISLLYRKNSNHNPKKNIIKKLTRQCSRWLLASQQDKSPLIAVLHLNYGMGYLWAIKDISTPQEFKSVTGVDWTDFENKATSLQDEITKNLVSVCPQYASDINQYFGKIAGDI